MKSLIAELERMDDAFLPWRLPTDSEWLVDDLDDIRKRVQRENYFALNLAVGLGVPVPRSQP